MDTGESAQQALTPSRRECRCFGFTCGDLRLCALLNRTQGCGCSRAPGIPCALCCLRGPSRINSGAARATGLQTFGCLTVCVRLRQTAFGRRRASAVKEASPDTLRPFGLRMAAPRVARKGEAWLFDIQIRTLAETARPSRTCVTYGTVTLEPKALVPRPRTQVAVGSWRK